MSIPASSTWAASTDKRKAAAYRGGVPGMTRPFQNRTQNRATSFAEPPCSSRHQVTLNPTSCPYRAELPHCPGVVGQAHCDRRWCPWRIGVREIVWFPIGCGTSVEARW